MSDPDSLLPKVEGPWNPPPAGPPLPEPARSQQRPGLGMGRQLAPAKRRRPRGRRTHVSLLLGALVVALLGTGGTALSMRLAADQGSTQRPGRPFAPPASPLAGAAVTPSAAGSPRAAAPQSPTQSATPERKKSQRRASGHARHVPVAQPRTRPTRARRSASKPAVRRTPKRTSKPKSSPKKCPIYDNGVLLGWTPC